MILDTDDAERFFKSHKALTPFVNRRLTIAKPPAVAPEDDRTGGRVLTGLGYLNAEGDE